MARPQGRRLLGGLILLGTLGPAQAGPDLAHQVGQMVMAGFRGTEVEPEQPVARAIRENHLGGVILFDRDVPSGSDTRNVRSPRQLRRLTETLRALADHRLLVAVDQEGGAVSRLTPRHGFRSEPAAAELARKGPAATRRSAAATARQLAEAGINWNLVPVVDLARNPDSPVIAGLGRSFGEAPERVIRHAAAVIRAHREAGVLTALKHFPGHGSAVGDTHAGPVDITATWSRRELIPYRALIRQDLADAVMMGHLRHRDLDPRWPASLSPAILRGLLREELGFQGVVITDDLQMGAIRREHDLRTVIRQALRAGADILLFANNTVYRPDIAARATTVMRQLVADGVVSRERIRRSYRRIRQLKERLAEGSGG